MFKAANQTSSKFICLTGFMGSGKSTVGAELAARLGWEFIDLDSVIVAQEGRSVAEIFRDDGEAQFRKVETQVLREVFSGRSGSAVIALGGGTFIQPANRNIIRSHGALTIFLEADLELLLERCCAQDNSRPLLQDRERFRALFHERQPIYRQAELVVKTDSREPGEVVSEIVAMMEHWQSSSAVPE